MKSFLRATAGAALLSVLVVSTAGAQDLSSFAGLAGTTVSNTGPSVIGGNIGVTPGLAIIGFDSPGGPGSVTPPYSKHAGDGVAINAMAQLISAYNALAGQPATADLSGQDLAGKTLGSGVYSFSSDAQLNGQLTLDWHGKTNGIFIFNIGSTLTAGAGSQVLLINGANANNVFFRVGSSATLLASAQFKGKILALQDITLVTAATINCGAALTQVGAVTLDTNTIGVCPVTAGTAGTGTSGSVSGTALGDAIQAYLDAGGVLPLGLGVLGLLTPDELAAALAELAGETSTGGQYTTGEAMDSFLEQLSGHHSPGDVSPAEEAPGQGTVSVMGYADASPVPGAGAFQDFDAGRAATVPHWHLWSAGYGNYSIANGDADAGTAERTSAAYGLTFGLERVVTSDVLFGFAISGGGTNFNLDNSLGSGHSAMTQAAAYGRVDSDRAYVSAATAYALHDMHSNRTVTLLGTDEFAAQFWTQDVARTDRSGLSSGLADALRCRPRAVYRNARLQRDRDQRHLDLRPRLCSARRADGAHRDRRTGRMDERVRQRHVAAPCQGGLGPHVCHRPVDHGQPPVAPWSDVPDPGGQSGRRRVLDRSRHRSRAADWSSDRCFARQQPQRFCPVVFGQRASGLSLVGRSLKLYGNFGYLPRRPRRSLSAMNKIEMTAAAVLALIVTPGAVSSASAAAEEVSATFAVPAGTVVIDTSERRLYLVERGGRALRYTVGVGRAGREWRGQSSIAAKFLEPNWVPPTAIRADSPNLPAVIAGGSPANPMGAAAMTLAGTDYAIHGTNAPGSIGGFVSYGCIRMFNADIADLYSRVRVGTPVIVRP